MSERLTIADVILADLADWRMIQNALHARFSTGSFVAGLEFVRAIAERAEQANHHPDVTLTYSSVSVRLSSHDVGGVTSRDIDLARALSGLAAEAGHAASTDHTIVDFGLDTHHYAELMPFWAAILHGKPAGDEVLTESGSPTVWFQTAEELADPPPQRWHPDVWVSHDAAEERIKAALDAGGRVVKDSEAPAYWVLADPQGNQVCICTNLER